MTRRVLVTRPEPGAARTAKRLATLGFEPVLLPVTQTVPLPVMMDRVLASGGTAVAVTSANAIRHAPPELLAALVHLPCHAVGEKTAQAARGAGFSAVRTGLGTAEALADEIAASLAGKTVVYLCGRVRVSVFEQLLQAASVRVLPVETYDTVALPHEDEAVAARLGGPVDVVLLYSAKAAEAVSALAGRQTLVPLLGNATFACLSSRVAGATATVAGDRIRVSREPNEEALFRLLSP